MNKIEKLLKELCPNGVEYKPLGELGSFYNGLNGKNKSDFTNGNARFISYMNVFTNIKANLEANDFVRIESNEKQNIIKVGDILFTNSSETHKEVGMSCVVTTQPLSDTYLNSFCFGFRFNNKDLFIPDFSKYLFRSEFLRKQIIKTASGVTRFNISKKKFNKIPIPLPPLEIKNKIVEILDKFTELEKELEKRKKQYEYYRNKLLSKEELEKRARKLFALEQNKESNKTKTSHSNYNCKSALIEESNNKDISYSLNTQCDKANYSEHSLDDEESLNNAKDSKKESQTLVKMVKLEEIGIFTRGNGLTKADLKDCGIPAIHYGQIHTFYHNFTYTTKSFVSEETAKKLKKAKKGDLIIVGVSENKEDVCKGIVYLGDDDVCISGDSFAFSHSQNPKFIGYALQTDAFSKYKKSMLMAQRLLALI
ncbi:MAG: restriction endonuclease subunit S [Helicobacteraceae bacterium]|nr:restriction endonuclease subunit S [Helicobacteraceae bacterium]